LFFFMINEIKYFVEENNFFFNQTLSSRILHIYTHVSDLYTMYNIDIWFYHNSSKVAP
jgi:hypothetical protein